MKVLLSWLKEFAPIDGEPDLIGEQLSELGLAVENMVRTGEHLEGVVVAKILDLRPHPDEESKTADMASMAREASSILGGC